MEKIKHNFRNFISRVPQVIMKQLTLDSVRAPPAATSPTTGGTAVIGFTAEAGVEDIGALGTGGTGGMVVGTGPAAAVGGGGGGGGVGVGVGGGGGGGAASFTGSGAGVLGFTAASPGTKPELHIRRGYRDNSEITFLLSQSSCDHTLEWSQ